MMRTIGWPVRAAAMAIQGKSQPQQRFQSQAGQTLATVRRAVFLGAQACALAYGRDNGPERFTWVESLFDLTAANDNDEGELALAA